MGHRKKHAPKRGSLAYYPRKRAKSLVPTIKTWPRVEVAEPILLGFAGYKAGMIGLTYIENDKNSIHYGKEIFTAATIVETPPLAAIGVVGYGIDDERDSMRALCTAFATILPRDLDRKIKNVSTATAEENLERLKAEADNLVSVRVLFATQPREAGISKKKPEVFEVEVGGITSVQERLEYAISLLGKRVSVGEVFKPGDVIDVVAVTKGKGFQGPVKRFGIKILTRKARKVKRKPGSLGPWNPAAKMYTVPSAGQMGFHRRTIYRVKILDIRRAEETTEAENLSFPRYGVVKSDYMILKGSVPGPAKR